MTPPRCLCGQVATGQVVEGHLHPYCAWEAEWARAERLMEFVGMVETFSNDAWIARIAGEIIADADDEARGA